MNLKFFTTALLATGATAGRQGFDVQKNAAEKIAGLHRFVDLHYRQGIEDKKNAAKEIEDRYRFASNMADKKWGEADE